MRALKVLCIASFLTAGMWVPAGIAHAEGNVAKDVREGVRDVDKDVDRDAKDVDEEARKLDKERHKEDRHLDKEEKKHL